MGGLLDSNLARVIATVITITLLGVGGMIITSTSQSAVTQEMRDISMEMGQRWGRKGNYTSQASEDVTELAIRSGIVPENLVNRSTTPPSLRNRDDGTIVLTLEPTRRVVTYTGLKESTCIAMVEQIDLTRDLASVAVNGTTETATSANPLTVARLRTLAIGCAANATLAVRWL